MGEGRSQADRALGGWLVLAARQAALTLITFGGVIVLGRLLGPADFALYGYTTIGVTLALAIGDLGLAARLIREDPSTSLVRRAFGAQVVGIAVFALATTAILVVVPMSDSTRLAAALVAVAILLAALQTLPTALLERRLAFRAISQIEVAQRALFTGSAVILAVAGLHLISVPAGAALAGVVGYAGALIASRWRYRASFRGLRDALGGFGSEWWQGRVATQAAYAAYPILGGLLFAPREVGFIVLALTVTSLTTLLAPLVARATFPAMAAAEPGERHAIFTPVFSAFVLVSLPSLAVVFVGAEPIVRGIFGEEWTGAVGVLRLTCVATIFGVALTPSLPYLYLLLEPVLVKRALVGWAAAQWALTPLAAPAVGLLAPAAAGVASATVAAVALDLRLWRQTGHSLFHAMGRPLAAALMATGAGAAVAALLDQPAGGLLGCAVTLVTYLAAVRGSGAGVGPRSLVSALTASLRDPPAPPSHLEADPPRAG